MVATAAPRFTPYDKVISPLDTGREDGQGLNRFVPIVHHSCFRPRRRLSLAQRKEMDIKQAALRIAAGFEERDLRELADGIGCSHTAIHNALTRLCARIGMEKFLADNKARANLSAARRRQSARFA